MSVKRPSVHRIACPTSSRAASVRPLVIAQVIENYYETIAKEIEQFQARHMLKNAVVKDRPAPAIPCDALCRPLDGRPVVVVPPPARAPRWFGV